MDRVSNGSQTPGGAIDIVGITSIGSPIITNLTLGFTSVIEVGHYVTIGAGFSGLSLAPSGLQIIAKTVNSITVTENATSNETNVALAQFGNMFTDGGGGADPRTVLNADERNAVQEELISVIQAGASSTLKKNVYTQLLQSIKDIIGSEILANGINADPNIVSNTGNILALAGKIEALVGDIVAGNKVQTNQIIEKTGGAGIKLISNIGVNAVPDSAVKTLIESPSGTSGLRLGLIDAPVGANSPRLIHDSSKHASSNRIAHWRMEGENLKLKISEPDFTSNLKNIFKITPTGKVGINHDTTDLDAHSGSLWVKDGIQSGGDGFTNSGLKWKTLSGILTLPTTTIAHGITTPEDFILNVSGNIRDAGSVLHHQDNGGAAATNSFSIKTDATNVILSDFGASMTAGLPFKVVLFYF